MLPQRLRIVTASVLLLQACENFPPGQREPATAATPPAEAAAPAERSGARARREPKARPEATGPEADAAFDQIRRSLRMLVAAEQGFYAENGTYTEDLDRLGYRAPGEAEVRFLWVTRQGWAASATHPALPGRDCVTFVGAANAAPTTLRYTRSGREGVVVCDAARAPRPAAGAPTPAASAQAPPAAADTVSALDAVSPTVQMRVDLRNLVQAQTAYFGTQGAYSSRPELLQLQFGRQRGVTVTLLEADRTSWSARATHADRPGKSCVVWYGTPSVRPATQSQRKVPDRPAVPACDD
jgi:hypothetical protein